jgi:hypothetical protein
MTNLKLLDFSGKNVPTSKVNSGSLQGIYFKSCTCEGKSKSKGTFQKKHIYCKYTETKLILRFNIILLDLNTPVPAFHRFFNSVRKKVSFFLVAFW